MRLTLRQMVSGLLALWERTRLARPTHLERAIRIEASVVLPARLVVIGILCRSFFFSPWIPSVAYSLDVGVELVTSLYWVYSGAVVIGGGLVLANRWLPPAIPRGLILLMALVDALFLAGLTLITGGYDSLLFWVFVVLVVRNTFVEPLSPIQLVLNLFTAGCYLLAGLSDFMLSATVDEITRQTLGLTRVGYWGDVLVVRTALLVLVAVCGFGVQLLLERQRCAEEEAREFQAREGQLQSMGRMAAEIAHQLKNPLAIINNTTFSLQRAVKSEAADVTKCTDIIREEIERADRILTQVMGYGHLAEETIEKLPPADVLDAAVETVFPEGTDFSITIERRYAARVPLILIQRSQLVVILVNVLTNARDACPNPGRILLEITSRERGTVEIAVEDNGPGIPAQLHKRIFEAYYTTKEKGTGLGLAIVKNKTELYGGSVRVESELGKGARFILSFPSTAPVPFRA